MGKLKKLQNQLLTDIFSTTPDSVFDQAGLAVYRANLRATATQALKITFPTVTDLIGEELLGYAAELLLSQHPPHHGDWARWGEQLPDILVDMEAVKAYPFVAPCARLDYHCHQLIRLDDTMPDHNSFSLLEAYEPDQLMLGLTPGLLLMKSEFPIAAIRKAHQLSCAEETKQAIQTALLNSEEQYHFACFRDGSEIRIEALTEDDFKFTLALQQQSLGAALSEMKETRFSFQHWLINAVQSNLLLNVNIST